MDRAVKDRLSRIGELAGHARNETESGRWSSALEYVLRLHNDTAFLVDWLRSQSEYRLEASPASADVWDPPAEPPLGNVTEPLSGTPDADEPTAATP